MGGWNHDGVFRMKCCEVCGNEFKPRGGGQKYCSEECGFVPAKKHMATASQYKLISGNWSLYFNRLLYAGGKKRSDLSRDDLLSILEKQKYLCALSGIELTCTLENGIKFWTNASIDRKQAGGPYSKDNIQLVCRGLNSWRSSIPIDEFVWYCRKVVEYHDRKEA